jgi:5-methylcytosine-specific restriction protein A
MSRSVEEWVGKTDDTAIPPRVKLRVFDRYGGVCQCGCGRKIRAGEPWDAEHLIALINGGENRERNLGPCVREHHKGKTARDVAIKSKTAAVRMKNLGIKRKSSRPMPGSKASGFRIRMNRTVERRT